MAFSTNGATIRPVEQKHGRLRVSRGGRQERRPPPDGISPIAATRSLP